MSLDLFFAENPLLPSSREKYSYLIGLFLKEIKDPEACGPGEILRWLDATGWSSATRYVAVVAVKRYIRWLYGNKHPALCLREKRRASKPHKILKPDQLRTLVQSFDTSTSKGKRNLAIVCLAIDTGFRLAELANLRAANVDFDERIALVPVKGGEWSRGLFSA